MRTNAGSANAGRSSATAARPRPFASPSVRRRGPVLTVHRDSWQAQLLERSSRTASSIRPDLGQAGHRRGVRARSGRPALLTASLRAAQQLHVRHVTTSESGVGQYQQVSWLAPNDGGGGGMGRFPPTTVDGAVRIRIVLRDSFNFRFFMSGRRSNLETRRAATETGRFGASNRPGEQPLHARSRPAEQSPLRRSSALWLRAARLRGNPRRHPCRERSLAKPYPCDERPQEQRGRREWRANEGQPRAPGRSAGRALGEEPFHPRHDHVNTAVMCPSSRSHDARQRERLGSGIASSAPDTRSLVDPGHQQTRALAAHSRARVLGDPTVSATVLWARAELGQSRRSRRGVRAPASGPIS
jgi:hypothetical protein